jgi:hypothetical protein
MNKKLAIETDLAGLARSLLHANTESEAIELLTEAGYWHDSSAWRLYGDRDGNFATIGNQQARPEAALVEKIVNAVDARLLNECLRQGVDPESSAAPTSIREAIAQFIDGKPAGSATGGRIEGWTNKKQLEQAKLITLAVTGNKPRKGMPSITIVDCGEGQTPARFPDTFLSIDRSNKLRIPFVQGKFNMGGTGALKFCGRNGLQLIISRRNPEIVAKWRGTKTKWNSTDERADEWAFTVVRRERPSGERGDVRNSVFRYLAPLKFDSEDRGQVLSFKADALPILPEENKPYERSATHGSVVKLFEYDMKGFASQALMKGGLLGRLEALLPNIALPVRVHECRDYRGDEARSFANSLVGLSVRLSENRGDNLERGYPTSTSFVVRQERMTAQIFAFKGDRAESYTTNEGVIFTINGQTHGSIPKTFFERSKVKMGRLAKSLLAIVDCTDLSVGAREDLFMNSRDRLSAGELRKEIEEEIESIIRNHDGLRELQARRRAEEIANRLEESKPLEQILDSIIRSSPTLTKLFKFGQRLSQPHRAESLDAGEGGGQGDSGGQGAFNPKPHPSYFRFHKKRDGERLTRNAELDRRCRIKFDTDAPNDYFERDVLPGRYVLEVLEGDIDGSELTHSCTIYNGVANWSIKLPEDRLVVGDQITLQCTVYDETRTEPFVSIATLRLIPTDEHGAGKRSQRDQNRSGGAKGKGGTGAEGSGGTAKNEGRDDQGGLTLPPIVLVDRADWSRHSFHFDENSACTAIEEADGSYCFYVNVDNIFLQTEMKETKSDVALKKAKFVWGNVLVGLSLIHQHRQERQGIDRQIENEESGQETISRRIDRTTRALGPFLLPMIDYLGALTDEEALRVAQRGDEA